MGQDEILVLTQFFFAKQGGGILAHRFDHQPILAKKGGET